MIEFVSEIPENEKIGVCCVLIDKWTNKVYLSKRLGAYETNKYAVPGGMVEPNEDWVSALCRELKEETGIVIKVPHLQYVTIAKHNGAKSNYTVWFKYYLSITEEPKNLEPEKHSDWTLFSINDALQLPLMLSTRETFLKYFC